MRKAERDPKLKIVCVCNQIPRDQIEAAIARGCRTVDRVSAATTAGAGQCGGTCRPEIAELINEAPLAKKP